MHARIVSHLGSQGIAIHFRHFNIGNHHQKLFRRILALVGHPLQIIECLAAIVELDDLDTNVLQAAGNLLARHRRVIHNQDATRQRLGAVSSSTTSAKPLPR